MYSQKWNCAASFPFSTFMYLWAIYIFPRQVRLFCCSKIGGPIVGDGNSKWKLFPDSQLLRWYFSTYFISHHLYFSSFCPTFRFIARFWVLTHRHFLIDNSVWIGFPARQIWILGTEDAATSRKGTYIIHLILIKKESAALSLLNKVCISI
jgi:hypothetical protein